MRRRHSPVPRASLQAALVRTADTNLLRGDPGTTPVALNCVAAHSRTRLPASKAGLLGLTRSIAREVASRNITCNAVAPGLIDTELLGAAPGEALAVVDAMIPVGRRGTPEDVAEAVAFLVSEAAGYITGQVLNVDGGLVMS